MPDVLDPLAALLDALARITWAEQHDGQECPANQIPTAADLYGLIGNETTDQANAIFATLRLSLSISSDHALWKKTEPPHPPHPLAPLVKAWQARPKTAEPFRPKQKANLPDLRKADSDTCHLLEIRQPVALANGQQLLLDLPELTPAAASRSWLLDLFDRAGGQSMRQGRGAPWDLRLFVGAMLHTHRHS